MKKIIYALGLFSVLNLFGQACPDYASLNGDLEMTPYTAPTGIGQLGANVPRWTSAATHAFGADHFATTGNANFDNTNLFGTQGFNGGTSYGGMLLGNTNMPMQYERVQYELDAPLVAGRSYKVSLLVSLAETSELAYDAIGASFSAGSQVFPLTGLITDLTWDDNMCNRNCITEKDRWVTVEGVYQATGGEQFIQLGPPTTPPCATSVVVPPPFTPALIPNAYYYFDSLVVEEINFEAQYDHCQQTIEVTSVCTPSFTPVYEWVYTAGGGLISPADLSCNNCPNPDVLVSSTTNVTLNVYCDVNQCHLVYTQDFTLEDLPDYWHQSTSNADDEDFGNGVYASPEGYVYNTGYFTRSTTFDDGTFGHSVTVANPTSLRSAYITCYTKCGELLWVAYDTGEGTSEGIDVYSINDRLYAAINYGDIIELTVVDNMGGAVNTPVTYSGDSYIIYALDAITGDHLGPFSTYHWAAIPDQHQVSAIDVNAAGGGNDQIFITGNLTASPVDNDNFVNAINFNSAGSAFSSLIGSWPVIFTGNGSVGVTNFLNDVTYVPNAGGRIIVTGSFQDTYQAGGFPLSTSGTRDAFYAILRPTNGMVLQARQLGSPYFGEGTSITTGSGYIYLAGNFDGGSSDPPITIASPFIPGVPTLVQNGTGQNGYLVSQHVPTNTFWSQEAYASNSDVFVTGVDADPTQVMMCGHYGEGIYHGASVAVIPNNPTHESRCFISSWNHSSWTPLYDNVTITNDIGSYHQASRISIQNGYAYFSGGYGGEVDYHLGNPVSYKLNSSGTGTQNAFIIRTELATGEMKIQVEEESGLNNNQSEFESVIAGIDQTENDQLIKAYPNPTNGMLKIDVGTTENAKLQLYNTSGQLIYQTFNQNQPLVDLDLTDFEKGIYHLKVITSEKVESLQLIKQ